MKPDPEITVLMPVYNQQQFLDESIQSILNQSFADFEFIIINDGSYDKSANIINQYSKLDKRIIIINNSENLGISSALNIGIKKSKGKYIARMDADDISLRNRLQEQKFFLDNNLETGVCGTYSEILLQNGKKKIQKHPLRHDDLKTRLIFSVPVSHPTVMMRSNVLKKYKIFFNENLKEVQDYDFWIKFAKYSNFSNIGKVLLKYREHFDSISYKGNALDNFDNRFKEVKFCFSQILSELNINNNERLDKLHFIISYNKFIKNNDVILEELDNYFLKLINSNINKKVFNNSSLINLLMKKILIVFYYKIKKRKIKDIILFLFKSRFLKYLIRYKLGFKK